jgi:hypothetical protein
MALGLLMFLQVGLLSKVNSAWRALERPNSLVDPLVHISVAG